MADEEIGDFYDVEREQSMADEGGAAGAEIEKQPGPKVPPLLKGGEPVPRRLTDADRSFVRGFFLGSIWGAVCFYLLQKVREREAFTASPVVRRRAA